jgi:hypothetical protein
MKVVIFSECAFCPSVSRNAKVQQAELSATEHTGVAVSKHRIIVVEFNEAKLVIFRLSIQQLALYLLFLK